MARKPQRENTLSINKLYKTLLLIVIVAGPIYWLMFTDDGKKRTDTAMLWLFSGESIDVNFAALDTQFREEDWKKVYPELDWQCQASQSPFGDRLCFSDIASYNGIPASYVSVFFNGPLTSAVKLVYRDQYHSDMGADLSHQMGPPANANIPYNENASTDAVLQWNTDFGRVMIKQTLKRGEEPVMLWLARKE